MPWEQQTEAMEELESMAVIATSAPGTDQLVHGRGIRGVE